MANAGTVTVDFAAEVAKFNASLKQVDDRVRSLDSGFRSLERIAGRALQFLSVAVATNFIRSAAQAAEEIDKVSDRLNISTERLVAFEIAAKDAGVEFGTFQRLLEDAQRRLGDAAAGGGAALSFIRQFGFDVRELQALNGDELFFRYADAIGQLKTRSDQFAAAEALFGRSAREAFDLIEQGRPAIEAAAETVDRLGLALSKVDSKRIREANDALGLLGRTSQAFGQQIAAAIAPFTTALVDSLTNSGVAADTLRSKIDQAVAVAFFAFQTMRNGALTLESAFFGLAAAGARVLQFLTFGDVSESFGAAVDANLERSKQALDQIQSFAQISEQYIRILDDSRARAEEAIAEQNERNRQLGTPERDLTFEDINQQLLTREELQQMHYERMLQMQEQFQEASAELTERLDVGEFVRHQQERERTAIESEQRILQFRQMAHNAAVGLLQALAGRSKAAALALIAINKARAIAETIQETARGVVFWTARGNLPMAAFTKALGAASIAAIAATGLVEARQVTSSPGPGAPLGSPTNPVFTDTATDEGQTFGAQQRSQIQVTVEGVITPGAARAIAEAIRDVVDNSDVHIIGPNSSQAQELRGG